MMVVMMIMIINGDLTGLILSVVTLLLLLRMGDDEGDDLAVWELLHFLTNGFRSAP